MLLLAWRGVRHTTGRYVATLVAILTGVSFFAASGFLGDRVVDSLQGDTKARYGAVDLAIVTEDAFLSTETLRIPGSVADEIVGVDGIDGYALLLTGEVGVRAASGEVVAKGAAGRLWIDDDQLNPLELVDGRGPVGADEIAIDRGLADDLDLAVGDETIVLNISGETPVTVVGVTAFGDSDSIDRSGTISVAAAAAPSWLAGGNVGYDGLYLRGPGTQEDLFERVQPLVPAGFEAKLGDVFLQERIDELGAVGRLLKRVLQAFSVLAMLVGGFVIYNTFNVLVAQRLQELAVLRAIGATPRQVRRALGFEGLVVGLIGSVLGVLLGVGFVFVLEAILGRFNVELPGSGVVLSASSVVQPILLGTVVTVISVMVPARRAARTEPIEALRDAAVESSPYSLRRLLLTVAVAVPSIAALAFGTGVRTVGAGLLGVFVATVAAGPILAVLTAKLTRPVMSRIGLEGRLASDNTARNPQRTSITANALLIGVFLVTLVSVAGTSIKEWVVAELDKIDSADFFLASSGGSLDDELIGGIRSIDGVEVVESFRRESVIADGRAALVSTAQVDTLLDITDIEVAAGSVDDLASGTIAADVDLGVDVGDLITLSAPAGSAIDLEVVAILELTQDLEYVGNLIDEDDFDKLVGSTAPTVAFVDVASGVKTESVEAIEARTENRPDLQLIDGNSFGKLIGRIFDFIINAVNGLLGMSVVVAVIGIVNTLSLSIFERRRELGLLRVVGMLDRDVQRMVRLESVLISILGTLVGIALGLFSGWTLLRAIQRQSEVAIPMNWAAGRVGLILVAGIALGLLASLIPSRRSTRLDVLDAVQAN